MKIKCKKVEQKVCMWGVEKAVVCGKGQGGGRQCRQEVQAGKGGGRKEG